MASQDVNESISNQIRLNDGNSQVNANNVFFWKHNILSDCFESIYLLYNLGRLRDAIQLTFLMHYCSSFLRTRSYA